MNSNRIVIFLRLVSRIVLYTLYEHQEYLFVDVIIDLVQRKILAVGIF